MHFLKMAISLPVSILDRLVASPINALSEWTNGVKKPSAVIKTSVQLQMLDEDLTDEEFDKYIIERIQDEDVMEKFRHSLRFHSTVELVLVMKGCSNEHVNVAYIEDHLRRRHESAMLGTRVSVHKQGTKTGKKPTAIVVTAQA